MTMVSTPAASLPFASEDLSARLRAHAQRIGAAGLRTLARDATRFSTHSLEAEGLLFDFTRQLVDSEALASLVELAEVSGVKAAFQAMFEGQTINTTEHRAVLHTALRDPDGEMLWLDGVDIRADIRAERVKLKAFVQAITAGTRVGSQGDRFTDVINIGIGGSDLGPVMAVEALKSFANPELSVHFVSNIDGVQFADLTQCLDPTTTLVVICSKTFTTLETLTNANLARAWIATALGEHAVASHFAAVSVNHAAMNAFGIAPDVRFTMWDWVGGRYSLWSAIGLSVELAVGSSHFEAMLEGARAMDRHARTAPLSANLPVLMGLLAVWNRQFNQCASHAVLPYEQRLHRLPAYLQQLSMESNGKRVRRNGSPVAYPTEAILWGEPGSNGQHSFFQLLHQGTDRVSMDFLLPAKSSVGLQDSQNLAAANCLAQAEAFAYGYTAEEARRDLKDKKLSEKDIDRLAPHKVHPGDRPSSLIVFERLDPTTLGKLIALYEHKVFVESVLWDINAFDQWGVELGKKMAERLAPAVRGEMRLGGEPGLQGVLDRLTRYRG